MAHQEEREEVTAMSRALPIKVLMCKPGLDGHDRGAKVLTLALRDAGFEVIYTGLRQTPEAIVQSATQEDVDVVGVSCLSGNHRYVCDRIIKLLGEKGVTDVLVIAGGIIPEDDIPSLKNIGVKAVFGPGSHVTDIVKFIRENVRC